MFGGTGRSELRVAGCVLGYPGVVTWVNGGCPRRDRRGSGRRRYVCIKMRTQVNTPCLPQYTPRRYRGTHPLREAVVSLSAARRSGVADAGRDHRPGGLFGRLHRAAI